MTCNHSGIINNNSEIVISQPRIEKFEKTMKFGLMIDIDQVLVIDVFVVIFFVNENYQNTFV